MKKMLSVVLVMLTLIMCIAVPTLADEKGKLTFTYWGSTYEKEVIENAISSFVAETGIEVESMIIPTDYETKLTTMIVAGNPPDVGYLSPQTAYKWFEEGHIYDIQKLFEADERVQEEDFIDGAVFHHGESIVGVMNNLESYAIFYNKDAFDAAGLEPLPTKPEEALTWDEFVTLAQRLTLDQNGHNAADSEFDADNIRQYGIYMNLWSGTFEALLVRNNTQYFPNMGDVTGINTPDFNEVYQRIADLMHVYHVMPTPTSADSMPAPAVSLQSRRYAMVIDGQWVCNDFAHIDGLNYGIGILPKLDNTRAIYSGALGVIFSGSEHPEEAWQLLQHITSVEASTELFSDGLWMPNRKIYYTDEEKIALWASESRARVAGYRDVLVDPIVNNSEVTGEVYVKNFGDINNILYPALDQVWVGKKTVDEVLTEIMPQLDSLLEGSLR